MDEDDAVLVTKKWWSRSHATKPSLISVVSAILHDDARPKKNCILRKMMAHFVGRFILLIHIYLNMILQSPCPTS